MNKSRMETFSDGVFAIVITLLILEIRVPEGITAEHLPDALSHLLPEMAAYLMSFFVVGLYWLVHHRTMHLLKGINHSILWINLLILLFVSIMPFTTGLLGSYPLQIIPIVVYGVNLILANFTGFMSIVYLRLHPELCHETVSKAYMSYLIPRSIITNALYLIGIAFAWIEPLVSYFIYVTVLILLILNYVIEGNKRKMEISGEMVI